VQSLSWPAPLLLGAGSLLGAMPIQYHSTKKLLENLAVLASSCSSPLNVQTVNTTEDGWPIKSATIGSGSTKVLLSFGIHGREYMTSQIAMNFMEQLCGTDSDKTKILKDVTFTMLPIFNPSGRARTDSSVGMRTTLNEPDCGDRRKNANLVDLNRNFDWDWDDDAASSTDSGSTSYRGQGPNSEVEAQTLEVLAGVVKPDMYIDIHTGTLAMYAPWNHNMSGTCGEATCTAGNDDGLRVLETVQNDVGWTGAKATWEKPRAGVGGIISYLASGTAADYMYAKHNPRYAFIWETYDQDAGKRAGSGGSARLSNASNLVDLGGKLPRGANPRGPRARGSTASLCSGRQRARARAPASLRSCRRMRRATSTAATASAARRPSAL